MKNLIIKNGGESTIDKIFGNAFGDFFRPLFYDEYSDKMKTDIKDNGSEYSLEIELAGFDKSDISINYEDDYLTVSAKKVKEEDKTNYLRKERSVSCSRSFYVGDINDEAIKAKYENGILSIVIPKEEAPKPIKKGIAIE